MNYFTQLTAEQQKKIENKEFLTWLLEDTSKTGLALILQALKPHTSKQLTKFMEPYIISQIVAPRNRRDFINILTPPPLVYFLQTHRDQVAQDGQISDADLNTFFEAEKPSLQTKALTYFLQNRYADAYEQYELFLQQPPEKNEKLVVTAQEPVNKAQKKQLQKLKKERENLLKERQQEAQRNEKLLNDLNEQLANERRLRHEAIQQQQKIKEALAQQLTEKEQYLEQQNKEISMLQKQLSDVQAQHKVKPSTQQKTKVWEGYVIGVVQPYDPDYPTKDIFINKSGEIQFWIQPVSMPSADFPITEAQITSWGADLSEQTSFKDHGGTDAARCLNLYEYVKDKFILFECSQRFVDGDIHWVAKKIRMIPRNSDYMAGTAYATLPIFTASSTNAKDIQSLVQKLQQQSYIGQIANISHEPEDTPPIIFYEDKAKELYYIGEFTSHHYAHGGFKLHAKDDIIHYGLVPQKLRQKIVRHGQIAFLATADRDAIIAAFSESATPTASQHNKTPLLAPSIAIDNNSEEAFFARWVAETAHTQLSYALEDLHNFHTCVKTGGLTIIAGMSGTGKSQLIQSYQRSLGLTKEQFLFIPVSPNWTDDADVIGYFDVVNEKYQPATTGLVDVLVAAQENPQKTYMICFDEMNLSRIEHYFSQFLSLLELAPEDRILPLYNATYAAKGKKQAYPASITIGTNVRFVGTINLDDSTHQLSDKALDRTNLMTLHVKPFIELLQYNEDSAPLAPLKQPIALQDFADHSTAMQLSEMHLNCLWEIHEAVHGIATYAGIGPRIVRQINSYMKNVHLLTGSTLTAERAFDLQIVQRVLSKIRGDEATLGKLIGHYDLTSGVMQEGQLQQIFATYDALSQFTEAKLVLIDKAKELARHGYAF